MRVLQHKNESTLAQRSWGAVTLQHQNLQRLGQSPSVFPGSSANFGSLAQGVPFREDLRNIWRISLFSATSLHKRFSFFEQNRGLAFLNEERSSGYLKNEIKNENYPKFPRKSAVYRAYCQISRPIVQNTRSNPSCVRKSHQPLGRMTRHYNT